MHYENPRLKGYLRELSKYPKADGEFAIMDVEPKGMAYQFGAPRKESDLMLPVREHGIGVTFDLSHYNIYSNYLSYGKGNRVGDLDRQIYGSTAPSWNECIDLFGDSLFQLHISGGKGSGSAGEGLILTDGEIPIIAIVTYIKYGNVSNGQVRFATSHNVKDDRVIRATIELREGHLYGGKLQRTAIEWLLTNTENVFC